MGKRAAQEDVERLREYLADADMIFITAGMGGGTGTGAAPVIAKVAKELGSLTVGVVTKPFQFEGKRRMKQAEEGMKELKDSVDTLIAIPNQRLLSVAGRNSSILETFKKADDVLLQAVRGISDLITVHGLINLDFADVRTIMSEMGMAMMGAAIAQGENRAVEAAQKAISSPLLEEVSINGARGVLINITGGPDLSLHEVNEAATLIQEEADDDANIIFGAVIDESMGDEVRITVIATGFGESPAAVAEKPRTARSNGPVAAASDGRPVKRLGLLQEDELDVPTWQRRRQEPPVAAARSQRERAAQASAAEEGGEDYDVPTFLRRGAE
jgi:cell division protein FtsZ